MLISIVVLTDFMTVLFLFVGFVPFHFGMGTKCCNVSIRAGNCCNRFHIVDI